MRIDGKVAVVAGGASGLGAATVRLLVKKGCKVAIWDKNEVLGRGLERELGPMTLFLYCDVTSSISVESALQDTINAFALVHILVNTAGVFFSSSILQLSCEDFDRVMQVNAYGTFNTCRAVAFNMTQQPSSELEQGVIVNTGSISGLEGRKGQVAYGSSKGFILSLTLPLARDLGAYGIRVATVAPGFFATPMTGAIAPETARQVELEIAMRRAGRPNEYARTVQYIIENSYVTGEVFRLDGGMRLPHL